MAKPLVLVAGAGPTGLTAAIELARAGLDVRIIDKSDHPARFSQALVVQARTLEQFQRYGIAKAAVARGRKMHRGRFFSDGKLIATIEFKGIFSRFPFGLTLPQTETEALLNEKLESLGVHVERQTELDAVVQREGELFAALRRSNGGTEQLTPRWLIGCDGAHSAVREMLDIPFEGEGVHLSFFLADLEMEGPDAPGDEIVLFLHHGDVVFLARLDEKLTRMIVVNHETGEGRNRELSIADFQRAADDAGVRIRIHSSAWMTPFHVNDRQAQSYRSGDAFLAGDASHIHSPAGGQGMNTGIQDVANLAWKMAAVARGADEKLLDSYEEERAEVGRALLKFTGRGIRLVSSENPMIEGLRNALFPVLTAIKPVQRAMLGFVSETAIEYRSSSIVADHGGDGELRAGDRLPDLTIRDGNRDATLLADWTEARHMSLLLDGSEADIHELRTALPFVIVSSIPLSSLDEEGVRLLGKEKKLLILRPDGYLGFRGPFEKREEWMRYGRQDGLISNAAGPVPELVEAHQST